MERKYKVVTYIRIVTDEELEEPMTYDEAKNVIKNLELMQPENRYDIEEVKND